MSANPLKWLIEHLPEKNRAIIRTATFAPGEDGLFDKIGGAPVLAPDTSVPECVDCKIPLIFGLQITLGSDSSESKRSSNKTRQLFICRECIQGQVREVDLATCKLCPDTKAIAGSDSKTASLPCQRITSWGGALVPMCDYTNGETLLKIIENLDVDALSKTENKDEVVVMIPLYARGDLKGWPLFFMTVDEWAEFDGEPNPSRYAGCCGQDQCLACREGELEIKLDKAKVMPITHPSQREMLRFITEEGGDEYVNEAEILLDHVRNKEKYLLEQIKEIEQETSTMRSGYGYRTFRFDKPPEECLAKSQGELAEFRRRRFIRKLKAHGLKFESFEDLAKQLEAFEAKGLWVTPDKVLHYDKSLGLPWSDDYRSADVTEADLEYVEPLYIPQNPLFSQYVEPSCASQDLPFSAYWKFLGLRQLGPYMPAFIPPTEELGSPSIPPGVQNLPGEEPSLALPPLIPPPGHNLPEEEQSFAVPPLISPPGYNPPKEEQLPAIPPSKLPSPAISPPTLPLPST